MPQRLNYMVQSVPADEDFGIKIVRVKVKVDESRGVVGKTDFASSCFVVVWSWFAVRRSVVRRARFSFTHYTRLQTDVTHDNTPYNTRRMRAAGSRRRAS